MESNGVRNAGSPDSLVARRAWRTVLAVGALLFVPVMVACSGPAPVSQASRVNSLFSEAAAHLHRDGIGSASAHVLADSARSSGGSIVNLWVTDPAYGIGAEGRCFYLYVDPAGHGSPFSAGRCGMPRDRVVLHRITSAVAGDIVFGTTGMLAPAAVRIESPGRSAVQRVTSGYFLIPTSLSSYARYNLTLLDKNGRALHVVTDEKPTSGI